MRSNKPLIILRRFTVALFSWKNLHILPEDVKISIGDFSSNGKQKTLKRKFPSVANDRKGKRIETFDPLL